MEKGKSTVGIKIFVAVSYLIMIAVNILANAVPINGITTGEVSEMYPNLFTPAAYTFSIWGLIYALLALFTLYYLGLFRGGRQYDESEQFKSVGLLFAFSSLANALWIVSWHYEIIWLSMLIMVFILVCLIMINNAINQMCLDRREKLFISLPFSIYFAWITVATIANATVLLVSRNWDGFGIPEPVWTAAVIVLGMIIGITAMLKNRDIAYGLVFIWAYIGILVKHVSSDGFHGMYNAVIATTAIAIALFVISVLYIIISKKENISNNCS